MAKIIGYDIGGTFTKWMLFDEKLNTLEKGKYDSTDEVKGYVDGQSVLNKIIEHANGLMKTHKDIKAIGVSTAGAIDEKTGIVLGASANIADYEGININETISKGTGLPVHASNDVNCAIMGEYAKGALKGAHSAFMITLGTGIGGAYMHNDQLIVGANNAAGEIGRNLVQGKHWEHTTSTKGLVKQVKDELNIDTNGKEFYEQLDGNKDYQRIHDEFMDRLAEGIMNTMNVIDPEIYLVGGGVTENSNFDIKGLNDRVNEKILLPTSRGLVKIAKATLGNDASAIGAAYLVKQQYLDK